MTQEIERIRAAHSALKPDLLKPWIKLDKLPYIHATDNPLAKPYSTPVVGRFDYMESADYILSCSPAAMTAVLAFIDAQAAEIESLNTIVAKCRDTVIEPAPRKEADAYWPGAMSGPEGVPAYLKASFDAQVAEIERLKADAARYQWLRKTTNWVSSKGQRIDVRNSPDLWDESIDSQIAIEQS